MRIFDGLIYRDATPEEEAENKAFEEEIANLPNSIEDKAEAYDILTGVSE